jgi:hypothetical protein
VCAAPAHELGRRGHIFIPQILSTRSMFRNVDCSLPMAAIASATAWNWNTPTPTSGAKLHGRSA